MPNLDYHDDNITVEWINGIKYMSPSPHPNHGVVYKKIFTRIANYLEGKSCELFPDKTDLCLANPESPVNIADLKKPLVPDLFVVCDNKFELVGNSIVAIPDFVCEIVSPSSVKMDNIIKKELYIAKGVKEYWILDYFDKTITVCFKGKESVFSFEDEVKVNIFNDLTVCLRDIRLFEV
ncbi:Uma2 family endonuclease [Clostridium punense]|uniref:Uma2 family endonuclease n=1 Tax=Clostridium punense TaxID=1054297 RepID=A0ABS4K7J4_9CLOT|nr:Uma2 family endonuclease [Clostridium punense]MBP2023724.1 Uma2 family endonuclease [Clostridium punense]